MLAPVQYDRPLTLAATHVCSTTYAIANGNCSRFWNRLLLQLSISSTDVDDESLGALKGMTTIKDLRLGDTAITSAGLKKIAEMDKLETLDLNFTGIDDGGVESLKALHHIRSLDLHGTSVTDRGLIHLKESVTLVDVDLSYTKISDEGLKALEKCVDLRTLRDCSKRPISVNQGHGKEAIPHRSYGRAVEARRTLVASGQAGWATAQNRFTGGSQRAVLSESRGLSVAHAAA